DGVSLWDQTTGRQLGTVPEAEHAYGFSPDGKTLVFRKVKANAIYLWDVTTGKVRGPATGHSEMVSALALMPDGKLLATGSSDGSIRLWDVAMGRQVRAFGDVQSRYAERRWAVWALAFSPSGTFLMSADPSGRV